jgi:hypothetical protein
MTSFPFVCEVCTIRANLGHELTFRPADCRLLGLEQINMIDFARLWMPLTYGRTKESLLFK